MELRKTRNHGGESSDSHTTHAPALLSYPDAKERTCSVPSVVNALPEPAYISLAKKTHHQSSGSPSKPPASDSGETTWLRSITKPGEQKQAVGALVPGLGEVS